MVDNILIARGDSHLTALIFPSFKNLRQIGLETSDFEHVEEQEAEPIVEDPDRLVAEVDEAVNSAFEEAGLNSSDPPSTSGQGDAFGDIFTNLGDLPGDYSEDMAKENLTQMARRKNTECMAARQKAEAIRVGLVPIESVVPIVVEETAHVGVAEVEKVADLPNPEERSIPDQGEKRVAEGEAGSEENLVDKRLRLEESDVVVPFVVQPNIKNTPISSEASAMNDPAIALSLTASVSLLVDKANFRAEPDLVAIALATQSALLTVGRIAKLGRRQHDAVERIGRLQSEVEGQRSRAEFEAMRETMESAQAEAEKERARTADQLRAKAEERANVNKESLKLAKEALAKLEAELSELKAAKEKADSEASEAFEARKSAALENYVEEVPKFENQGFKHGWLKALAAAGVTLDMSIPYEQVDIEPLESDAED
ncbi:uncharacterized protein LOC114288003 [Camellia sinensis]|uniref:uncharacterized protein LOC114288003 n=1 Tax=Camellia sinensis TaxID=4442 RepID=UPI0010367EC2|nr:uncharacterized protein LOC114288003 [Camellia sinensis]